MNKIPFDRQYALLLLLALAWTTAFSLTNSYPVRGLRNLGILACYGLSIVMLVRLKFATAAVTWLAFGLAAGLIYSAYHCIAFARTKAADRELNLSVTDFVYGPLAWPIMIPEAVEYSLAELGVLKSAPQGASSEIATPNKSNVEAPPPK